MSKYDREYFFSFDDYKKINQNQPIPLKIWRDVKFDFYEMRFENGVSIFLLNTLQEAYDFKAYCSFTIGIVPFIGLISDINDRVVSDTIGRSTKDLIDLCEQLSDKKFGFLYSPTDITRVADTAQDIEELLKKYTKY